jgi:hypothetical protein
MRFYYWSFLNWIPITIFYVIVAVVLWILWRLIKDDKNAKYLILGLIPVMLILPWTEELWIAERFDRLCKKDAGIFIYKTVEVEGFYNGSGATLDLVRPGGYRFIESYSKDGKSTTRLEFGDTNFMRAAIARYEQENAGKSAASEDVIRVNMDKRTEALVFPKKGESWRVTKIDHPTAKYHYKTLASHLPVSHRIKRFENVVVDHETGDVLGRYLNYYRGAPWFYIGLDRPTIPCIEAKDKWAEGHSMLVWQSVLLPKK